MGNKEWYYEISLLDYFDGDVGTIEIEELYQLFKERLLREMKEEQNNGN